MLYTSGKDWLNAKTKQVMLFAMSGLGKTYTSDMLRQSGDWFHYSVDYRIGTRYMGEHIVDNFKREAMKTPFLAELLRSDSIYIASNITFENLTPLSTYLGKPGNPDQGGIAFAEYLKRQQQHRTAEIASLMDTAHFIERAQALYGYSHFIGDSGGSICEVVDPEDPNDPVLKSLSDNLLMVWIEGSDDHTEELIRRFDKAPKPMYYHPKILEDSWSEYLNENNIQEDGVNPNKFIRWAYRRAVEHRQPQYRAIAQNWGVTVQADDVAKIRNEDDFNQLIAQAIDARM
ncbi:ATPase [Halocynthiibacter sp.]|uniref:ATPase n=1 Tax=Halocynthiibacter sp. TaxID=1979210 RepID=UPI003C5D2F1C